MAGIVVTVSIGYTNNWAIECVVGISQRLDEGFAMEQRKAGVAITSESFAQPLGHFFPLHTICGFDRGCLSLVCQASLTIYQFCRNQRNDQNRRRQHAS